jgi:hypothetical protein
MDRGNTPMKQVLERKRLPWVLAFLVVAVGIGVLAFAVTHGLRSPVSTSSLIGTYAGQYLVFPKITKELQTGLYKDSYLRLELLPGDKYIYHRTVLDGNEFTNIGTWKLEGGKIFFHNFTFGFDPWGPPQHKKSKERSVPSLWSLPVERTITGRPKIWVDPDGGYYFVKVSDGNLVD